MESPIATQITCTQCGGELHPDEGQAFLTCPYCSATVYLEKSRVVFHWAVAPTLDERQALGALYRWMSGSQTVKDLDKKAQVTGQAFQYFPVWYFKWQGQNGEQELLRPAAATSITELSSLKLPAGDLQRYDPALDPQAAPPSVPLEAALAWLDEGSKSPAASAALKEAAVVHVPLYFYKYVFGGRPYTAVVDAASGNVLASLYPPKAEAPYLVVGVVTALVYLCLATVPLFSLAIGGDSGSMLGLLLCAGLGAVAAPLLFAWAFWVASKV